MRITPLDVRRQRFRKAMRGYDSDEVNAFLEMVANALEELVGKMDSSEKELVSLRARAAEFDRMEGTVREVLIQQQKSAENARADADKEAELIIMDAEVKAANLISEARSRVQVLSETIRDLQDRRLAVLAQIRAFVDSQNKMLELEEGRIKAEMVPENTKLPGDATSESPMLELSELD